MTGRRTPLLVLVLAAIGALVLMATWFVLLPRRAERRLVEARTDLAAALGRAEAWMDPTSDPTGPPAPTAGPGRPGERWSRPIPRLEEGLRALDVTSEEGERLGPLVRKAPGEWTEAERTMVTALARREAEALAMIERAGISSAPPGSALIEGSVPLMETVLRGSTLLLARAGLALHTAPAEAGRSVAALGGIARALADDSGMHAAVRTAVEDLFLRGVHWVVESPGAPAPVLEDLHRALPEHRSRHFNLRLAGHLAPDLASPEPPRPIGWWGRVAPWWPAQRRARELESLALLARACREPGRLREIAGPAVEVLKTPETVEVMLRIQAVESARILARLSLDLRLAPAAGRTEGAVNRRLALTAPDPLAGARPRATPWVDGSLMLENPEAEKAWQERWGVHPGSAEPPPYAWLLPPPGGRS